MISVAIDGPAGAGKSTISKTIAKNLGYIYVDTGALYRAVGLCAIRSKVDTTNVESVINLLKKVNIKLAFINQEQRVMLNGEDVSELIRTPEASMAASNVSAIPEVRTFLFDLQREIAKNNNIIMDGRDIGTVVLPNATVKIFLTASADERAKRRYDELIEKGMDVVYEDVLEDMKKRDFNDSNRAAAPLKAAEDAVIVDTTGNTLEQSIEEMTNIVKSSI